MLDLRPQLLLREIQVSHKICKDYTRALESLTQRYHGQFYKEDLQGEFDPVNAAFEYIALISGRTVFSNPRVKITAHGGSKPDLARLEADYLEDGANRWVRLHNLRELLLELVVDYAFNFGWAVTMPEPIPGYDGDLFLPYSYRVPQERVFYDAVALNKKQSRFTGHVGIMDQDDMIELAENDPEGGWNIQNIKALQRDAGLGEYRKDRGGDTGIPSRNEVVYYQVHIPEHDMAPPGREEEFHGALAVLAVSSSGDGIYLRDPVPFFGPASGPYTLFGAYMVPSKLAPLGPLAATESQSRELNNHEKALSRTGSQRKSIMAYDGLNGDDEAKINNAKDGEAVRVQGLDKAKVVQMNLLEPTPSQIQLVEYMRMRHNRALGLSEAQRGNVTGVGTATQDAIANDAASTRNAHVDLRFQDGVNHLMENVVWYLKHDPRVVFHTDEGALFIGGQDPREGIRLALKHGLVSPEDAAAYIETAPALEADQKWNDLDVEIESYSMSRTSEMTQQQRLMQGTQIIEQALPLIVQFPEGFDWERWFDRIGEALNWPDLGSFLHMDKLRSTGTAQPEAPQGVPLDLPQGLALGGGGGQTNSMAGLPGNRSGAVLAAQTRKRERAAS